MNFPVGLRPILAIAAAAVMVGSFTGPSVARHADPKECILVDGEWYCPLRVCHIDLKKLKKTVAPGANSSSGGGSTVVIVVPGEEPPVSEPKPPKEDHDNGHGNDDDHDDDSNPGKGGPHH